MWVLMSKFKEKTVNNQLKFKIMKVKQFRSLCGVSNSIFECVKIKNQKRYLFFSKDYGHPLMLVDLEYKVIDIKLFQSRYYEDFKTRLVLKDYRFIIRL